MKKMCYLLMLNDETANAVRTVALCVPCFIALKDCGNGYGEYTIECRQEDVATVERKLAAVV